ncbi:hypothetical protein BdWA1_000900 [Babesia duncani]|uniref:Uncharacterized protein n=1 Tax=Babesia duncani TaxID=323732 RepID=A0AAD9PP04_9APIC|nr:hypothetical protein BdWA1_000900 [Babesia duncani]
MKAAYRQAVGMFGGENCRKVYNCFPRLSEYNVGYNCARSPSSLRLGSLDEVKEALRLKISSCQGLGDETACVTWFVKYHRRQHARLERQVEKLHVNARSKLKSVCFHAYSTL